MYCGGGGLKYCTGDVWLKSWTIDMVVFLMRFKLEESSRWLSDYKEISGVIIGAFPNCSSSPKWHLLLCNITNLITDISTLQFIRKLHNFIHIISMHSNWAAIMHTIRFQPDTPADIRSHLVPVGFKKMNLVHPRLLKFGINFNTFCGTSRLSTRDKEQACGICHVRNKNSIRPGT